MTSFYRVLLWASELELALALAAPARNPRHVKACEDDVSRWELELFKREKA